MMASRVALLRQKILKMKLWVQLISKSQVTTPAILNNKKDKKANAKKKQQQKEKDKEKVDNSEDDLPAWFGWDQN